MSSREIVCDLAAKDLEQDIDKVPKIMDESEYFEEAQHGIQK